MRNKYKENSMIKDIKAKEESEYWWNILVPKSEASYISETREGTWILTDFWMILEIVLTW